MEAQLGAYGRLVTAARAKTESGSKAFSSAVSAFEPRGEDEQQDDQISAEKSVVKLKIGDDIKLTERLSWRFSRHSLPRLKPSSSSRLPTRFRLDGWPQSFRYLVRDIVLDHQDIVEPAIVGFRPNNIGGVGTDQARGDPHPGA